MSMAVILLVLSCMLPPVLQVAYSVATGTASRARSFSAVFAGLVAVFLASVAQTLLAPAVSALTGVPALFVTSFAEAALVEETAKLALIAAVCRIGRGEVGLPAEGTPDGRPSIGLPPRTVLSVALTVGLSFSSFETLSYALGASSFPWIRLFTALPVHAAAAVCSGALVVSVPRRRLAFVGSFALAVALHGAYTASLSLRSPAIAPALAFMCALVVLAVRSARAVRAGFGDSGEFGDSFAGGEGR